MALSLQSQGRNRARREAEAQQQGRHGAAQPAAAASTDAVPAARSQLRLRHCSRQTQSWGWAPAPTATPETAGQPLPGTREQAEKCLQEICPDPSPLQITAQTTQDLANWARRAVRAQRAPSARGSRAPGEGLHRIPATCLAGTGMGTQPHCSRSQRICLSPQLQNISECHQSHRLMPCLHGVWSGAQTLSPEVSSGRWKLTTVPGKTHPRETHPRKTHPTSPGWLHHLGCRKSRGGRMPWCILSLPHSSYPGAAAPSALLSIPACGDRARGTQPQTMHSSKHSCPLLGALCRKPLTQPSASCSSHLTAEQQRCLSKDFTLSHCHARAGASSQRDETARDKAT